ncbi:MAG: DsbE family thiol:disulfide interchange protein [Pseudomonadota bacterium]
MTRIAYLVPLALFAFIAGLGGYLLTQPKDEAIPSQMVAKPLPEFDLPPAGQGLVGVSDDDFVGGQPKLLNLWASWCLPCIAEAPHLASLEQQGAEIIGIAIRDKPEDVAQFLAEHGNPYTQIGADNISGIQFELGSSGLPETYVIDAKGVIRHQHIGDIRAEHVPLLLERLEAAK